MEWDPACNVLNPVSDTWQTGNQCQSGWCLAASLLAFCIVSWIEQGVLCSKGMTEFVYQIFWLKTARRFIGLSSVLPFPLCPAHSHSFQSSMSAEFHFLLWTDHSPHHVVLLPVQRQGSHCSSMLVGLPMTSQTESLVCQGPGQATKGEIRCQRFAAF